MQGIYKIKNLTNGKYYIGSAANFYKRMEQHLYYLKKNIHHSIHLQRAWNKYGAHVFIFGLIEEVNDQKQLIQREQFYIDTLAPEYNVCPTAGSRLGSLQTKETIEKIRKNATKFWLGKNLSEDTKKKIGDANRGHKHSAEAIAKIAFHSQGENHPMFGKTHNDESKKLMSKAKAKPIGQYTLDGTLIRTWTSGKEVQLETDMSQGNINKVCLGKYKRAYGYIWKFI